MWWGVRIQGGVEYKVVWSYNTMWCGVTRWCRGTLQAVAELQYKVLWSYNTRCCGVAKQGVVELQYKMLWGYNTRWCTSDARKRGTETEGGQLCVHCTFGFEMASAP